MIRVFVLGVTVVVLVLVVITFSLVLVFATIRLIKKLFFTGRDYVGGQYQRWKMERAAKEAEKRVPDFLKQAGERLRHIDSQVEQLHPKWQGRMQPLIREAKTLWQRSLVNPEQSDNIRSFFTVTLKALEGLTQALLDMQGVMQPAEAAKAQQNIERLMTDVYKYRARLESKKRFDFHVMMELIKQRLGR